jgi:hypothetical protein
MPSKWQSKPKYRQVLGRSVPEVADRPKAEVQLAEMSAGKRPFPITPRRLK